jgi:hypothetical protein
MSDIELRLRDEVRQRPAPEPSESLLRDILARRAAGERRELPRETPKARKSWRWVAASLAAAAGVTLIVVGSRSHPSGTSEDAVEPLLGPGLLYAEATDHPTFPVVRAARLLRPGRWRYQFQTFMENANQTPEDWLIQRSTGEYEGEPAYRYGYGPVVGDQAPILSDTLWLDHETMRPIARAAVNLTGGRVLQLFQANTVLSGYTTAGGMTSWSSAEMDSLGLRPAGGVRWPADLYDLGTLTPWRMQIAAVLESADLSEGWRGSMEAIIAPAPLLALRFWVNFQVVGTETVTVPAGRFETWKIQMGKHRNLFAWVSKDRQWLIRLGPERAEGWNNLQVLVSGESGEE